MKKGIVQQATGSIFTAVPHITMLALVGNGLSIATVTNLFHCVCHQFLIRIKIPLPASIRYTIPKGLETGFGTVLHCLMYLGNLKTMVQVPLQQWGSQEDLRAFHTANERSPWLTE